MITLTLFRSLPRPHSSYPSIGHNCPIALERNLSPQLLMLLLQLPLRPPPSLGNTRLSCVSKLACVVLWCTLAPLLTNFAKHSFQELGCWYVCTFALCDLLWKVLDVTRAAHYPVVLSEGTAKNRSCAISLIQALIFFFKCHSLNWILGHTHIPISVMLLKHPLVREKILRTASNWS